MMETLSPWHAVLQQQPMVRPAMGVAGMVGIRAWTLIPAMLLLLLGKHTTWGWSWVQSKTYDPGGSCQRARPLRPDVVPWGAGAPEGAVPWGAAPVRVLLWGAVRPYSGGPNPS